MKTFSMSFTLSLAAVVVTEGSNLRPKLVYQNGSVQDAFGVQACASHAMYSEDSACNGEVLKQQRDTVGTSMDNGCVNDGVGGSRSEYCDSEGYHSYYFSSPDCAGEAYYEDDFPNGCNRGALANFLDACSLAGPCSDEDVKNV